MKLPRFKRPVLWPLTFLTLLLIAAAAGFTFSRIPQNNITLQIRPARAGLALPDGFFVYQSLNERGIRIKSITPLQDGLIVQLDNQPVLQWRNTFDTDTALVKALIDEETVRQCKPGPRGAYLQSNVVLRYPREGEARR